VSASSRARTSRSRGHLVFRGPRGVIFGFTILLMLAVVFAFVRDDLRGAQTAGLASTGQAGSPAGCKAMETREACREIVVDGIVRRYALIAASKPTKAAVIVDFGGPGQSILMTNQLTGLRANEPVLEAFNLIVLEEPWVTANLAAECTTAMGAFYLSLRADPTRSPEGAGRVAKSCDLNDGVYRFGFSPGSYRALVDSILDREGLTLKGFIGHSWGSVRLSYLHGKELAWTILVRPFPVGVDASTLVTARVEALDSIGTPPMVTSQTLPARSVPVTTFDSLTAWVALGYTDDALYVLHRQRLRAGTDVALIAEMSDNYWGRYGQNAISPAFLAQAEETCATVGGWGEPMLAEASIRGILSATFLPCAVTSKPGVAAWPNAARTCIVTSPTAVVTPEPLELRFSPLGPASAGPTWISSSVRSHGSFDGLDECLDDIGQVRS
jgi:hypothetical protein